MFGNISHLFKSFFYCTLFWRYFNSNASNKSACSYKYSLITLKFICCLAVKKQILKKVRPTRIFVWSHKLYTRTNQNFIEFEQEGSASRERFSPCGNQALVISKRYISVLILLIYSLHVLYNIWGSPNHYKPHMGFFWLPRRITYLLYLLIIYLILFSLSFPWYNKFIHSFIQYNEGQTLACEWFPSNGIVRVLTP